MLGLDDGAASGTGADACATADLGPSGRCAMDGGRGVLASELPTEPAGPTREGDGKAGFCGAF